MPYLQQAGLDAAAITLPSSGGDGDMTADGDAIRAALRARPGPTVVVAHSYGGIPVTEVAGTEPNVFALVYLCSFQLDVGESLQGVIGGAPPPWAEVDEAAGTTSVPDPIPIFYADVELELAQELARQLTPQTLSSFASPLTQAAWRTVPSTYVVCSQDQAIPVVAQQAMSARSGLVHTLDSSHSCYISHPEQVTGIIAEAALPNSPADRLIQKTGSTR